MIRLTFITLTNDVINGQFDHHLVSKRIMGLAMIIYDDDVKPAEQENCLANGKDESGW